MRTRMLTLPALALAVCVGSVEADGASPEIVFTRVVDDETPNPRSGLPFRCFELGEDESLAGRRVRASLDDEGNVAFTCGGTVSAIVDGELRHVMGSRGEIAQLEIEHGRITVAYYGETSSSPGGIFRWEAGRVIEVAGRHTSLPEAPGCFFHTEEEAGIAYRRFSVEGDAVLFSGTGDGFHSFDCDDLNGTFAWRNGSIQRISHLAQSVPIDAGRIAFLVWSYTLDGIRHLLPAALYTQELDRPAQKIAEVGDLVPGGNSTFEGWFKHAAVAAGRVGFVGSSEGVERVYLWENGSISVVVEEGMELPGGRTLETMLSPHSPIRLAADRIVVFGRDVQGPFLYLASLDRGWETVVDLSGVGSVTEEDLGDFDRRQLAIDTSEGVYVLRADGSLLEVLRDGDLLDGRVAEQIHAGDLRGNALLLGIEEAPPGHFESIHRADLPPLAVGVDVKPSSTSNRIRRRSRRPVRVALLGSETFYVEDVDPSTLGLGPAAAPPVGPAKLRDVNGDGWDDLVLRFRPRETQIESGASELCLSGETLDGVGFEGCDEIRTKGRARAPAR